MLNMDFTKTVCINVDAEEWVNSPAPGVERKPLAREDSEQGHATSIVRYLPGAKFAEHDHPKGEEIFVLEGTFSDQTGDYSKGTYFRNPEGFRHSPSSAEGCIILVKLHQFQISDTEHVCIDTNTAEWIECGDYAQMPLHKHDKEEVSLFKLPPDSMVILDSGHGAEVFVIEGQLKSSVESLNAGTWVRTVDSPLTLKAETESLLWVKTGHIF